MKYWPNAWPCAQHIEDTLLYLLNNQADYFILGTLYSVVKLIGELYIPTLVMLENVNFIYSFFFTE